MSDNSVSLPLNEIIARMAKTNVSGPIAAEREKLATRMKSASKVQVALLDFSGSMADSIGSLNMSKEDHLKISLQDVMKSFPDIILVPFASSVKKVDSINDLPKSGSRYLGFGTNMAAAIQFIHKLNPAKTIIISDGIPDDQLRAVEEVRKLTGVVDTIYCGPDNHPAVKFLASLAREGCGSSAVWSGFTELSTTIRGLLPAPEIK